MNNLYSNSSNIFYTIFLTITQLRPKIPKLNLSENVFPKPS